MFLALYLALKEVDASLMLIATALAMLSVVGFIVSRPPFEMLRLSQQYAIATTDAQRASLQAAGEVLLAVSLCPWRSRQTQRTGTCCAT